MLGVKKPIMGRIYVLRDVDDTGNDIQGKVVDFNREGYYVFKVTTRTSDLDEFSTKRPEENVFEKGK